jgi:hypothetical protein
LRRFGFSVVLFSMIRLFSGSLANDQCTPKL